MEHKFFEIRDEGTHIPTLALKITVDDSDHSYFLQRAGLYGRQYVILIQLGLMQCQYDAEEWMNRTMMWAHRWINDNFDGLQSGQVVDVRYILGETSAPAESERKR